MANSAKAKIAQKIPIRPSKAQAAAFERCFGERRLAYNSQVAAFDSYDAESNPDPSYPGVSELKAVNPWMAGSPMPSNALSNAIMDFRKARSAYFRAGRPAENRPRFKSKRDPVQSFRNSMPIKRMEGRRYPLSKKLGSVKIPKRDPLRFPISALSSWTVKREGAKYYLVLLFDAEPVPLPPASGEVGIDLGVKDLMVLSTGERVDAPERMRELEEGVRREQRRLSRKRKGSANWRKQRARLNGACARLRHFREDFQHRVSRRIVEDNQFVAIEDLAVRGMTRKPSGRGSAGKRAMNRLILRGGWAGLAEKLEYKCEWHGREFVRVGRFYPSSKTCGECGSVNRALRLSDRAWTCPECGAALDRDLNAARNILAEGLRLRSGAA